jgi:hypothetical protein
MCAGFATCVGQTNECRVSGTATDKYDFIEQGAIVEFKSAKMTNSTKSDLDGAYSLSLSPGIYEIKVKRASELRYRRARLAVSCPNNIVLNIYVLPECVSYGCRSPGFGFSNFTYGWTKSRSLDLLIAYNTSKKSKNRITYKDAMVTYDKYTLSAEKVVQDLRSKTITAEGNGWIEDGKGRRTFTTLALAFGSHGFQIR